MLLWRLSGQEHAAAFDGGYGLHYDGRWNTAGHAVTYCATSPALCVLEKLVHIEDPTLLPALMMVTYEVQEPISVEAIRFEDLPEDWRLDEGWSQRRGDAWHNAGASPLLMVPSVVVPLKGSPDVNVVINNDHPASARIRTVAESPFSLDPRLR